MSLRRLGFLGFCVVLLLGLTACDATPPDSVTISSPAFSNGDLIPARYARANGNVPPALQIKNVPARARSLALIVDDPDAPAGLWTHWLVWNLPANTTSLSNGALPSGALEGKNSFGNVQYDGPAPPNGTHRYFFRIYALDASLALPSGASRNALMAAMNGHVVATGKIFGTYQAGQ